MDKCRFCEIIKQDFLEEENKVIAQNDNYYAISSVGALVEGWILIIPKKHSCSMKDVYSDESFIRFTNKMITALKKCYGDVIVFEHGANREGSETSCGTNHAHIHIVPYHSLTSILDGLDMKWDCCFSKEISKIVGDKEYLYYSDIQERIDDTEGRIHILEKPISQFFRYVIANDLGIVDKYSYKLYPDLYYTKKTIKELGEYFKIIKEE